VTASRSRLIVAAGLVWVRERVLVQRRSRRASHGAGRLELPGGKVEHGENPRRALVRELVEEWGPEAASLVVGRCVEVVHHIYPRPGPEVVLLVFEIVADHWAPRWDERIITEPGVEVFALPPTELEIDEFLAADRALVTRVRDGAIAR
jgi:8-oxo-dGTP diphosphatase